MGEFTQENRRLQVDTPLGKDVVVITGLTGTEAISRLFSFQLDLIAENKTNVAFDKLLGKSVTVHLDLPDDTSKRHINGICIRMTQGERGTLAEDSKSFTSYKMEIVPKLWRLSQKAQSRIFQQLSVPDILKKVLGEHGVEFTPEIQGTFHPRDYCVQYHETDFNFVSRLMEEEGIYYFFKHADGSHNMVLANTPGSHPAVPGPVSLIYEHTEGGARDEDRIHDWQKTQELRPGKYVLWDHSFELPHKHLEAEKTTLDAITVGTVSHKLKVGENEKLEIYDFPGEYAQRYDGIDKSGGDRPSDIQHIFEDNDRTVGIRMGQEETPGLLIKATSTVRHLVAGHKFTLERHFNANGEYVIVSLSHAVLASADFRSGTGQEFQVKNTFTCLPSALPFTPPRVTPRPFVQGTQTAVVVGPPGEEIFTDKYGRVKVQFHWDREGKNNADSSCWVRVGTMWAGRQWGAIHIPRIGHEVIVAFQEGDPDQPIIVGSVYNADMMPPYELPENKTQSGIKSRSSKGGGTANFNELRLEDKKGQEQVYLHAERNLDTVVEADETRDVGHDRTTKIHNDDKLTVDNDRTTYVGRVDDLEVGADRSALIHVNDWLKVEGERLITCKGMHHTHAKSDLVHQVDKDLVQTVTGQVTITAQAGLTVTTPTATFTVTSLTVQAAGAMNVTAGGAVSVNATGAISLTGSAVTVNAGVISLNAAMVACSGVLSATTVIATAAVVSPAYTPGAGNIL